MSAFREPHRKLSWDEMRAISDEVDVIFEAANVRGGHIGIWADACDWDAIVMMRYEYLRGDLTDCEWQQVVAVARATIAHAEVLLQALERHETSLDVRASALAGPLA